MRHDIQPHTPPTRPHILTYHRITLLITARTQALPFLTPCAHSMLLQHLQTRTASPLFPSVLLHSAVLATHAPFNSMCLGVLRPSQRSSARSPQRTIIPKRMGMPFNTQRSSSRPPQRAVKEALDLGEDGDGHSGGCTLLLLLMPLLFLLLLMTMMGGVTLQGRSAHGLLSCVTTASSSFTRSEASSSTSCSSGGGGGRGTTLSLRLSVLLCQLAVLES